MKKNLILFVMLFVSAITFADKPKSETVKIKTSAICEQCKETIEKKLAFTKGVMESSVDLDSKDKVTTVIFNPKKTSVEKIKKAISAVGYDADELVADPVGYEKLPGCCKKGGMRE
ncbi:heavy-metal-associated domain-containing protein [Arcicella sp. LKC2W]|uniref:heavy-metal-associated domain-containing protein n=1 Tax=Arcicella sp. LKC2W TaxID=2984198 RepID=UPI002B213D03|nr:heavy-metal-associated domain-containing protein [Arcicella sp. LKC2W]MEA5461458.1 heavy-metal-associated domain-containing protein [Arcicella sp. LKC2W]